MFPEEHGHHARPWYLQEGQIQAFPQFSPVRLTIICRIRPTFGAT